MNTDLKIFQKEQDQTVILVCLNGSKLSWFKCYRVFKNFWIFPLLKRDFEDGGATAILQIAFLNRAYLLVLSCKLLFNKFVHRLEHMTWPNTRPILALKAY